MFFNESYAKQKKKTTSQNIIVIISVRLLESIIVFNNIFAQFNVPRTALSEDFLHQHRLHNWFELKAHIFH